MACLLFMHINLFYDLSVVSDNRVLTIITKIIRPALHTHTKEYWWNFMTESQPQWRTGLFSGAQLKKRPFNRTPTSIPPFSVLFFVVCVRVCVNMCIYALCEPCGNSGCSLHLGSVEYLQVCLFLRVGGGCSLKVNENIIMGNRSLN